MGLNWTEWRLLNECGFGESKCSQQSWRSFRRSNSGSVQDNIEFRVILVHLGSIHLICEKICFGELYDAMYHLVLQMSLRSPKGDTMQKAQWRRRRYPRAAATPARRRQSRLPGGAAGAPPDPGWRGAPSTSPPSRSHCFLRARTRGGAVRAPGGAKLWWALCRIRKPWFP